MKYRLLWAAALAGVLVQSTLAIREGVFSISGVGSGAVLAGLAVTSASILLAGLLWARENNVGSGRPGLIIRLAGLGIVASGTAVALVFASMADPGAAATSTANELPQVSAGSNPALVAAQADSLGATESTTHVHTDATTASADANPESAAAAHSHGAEVPVTDEQLAGAAKLVADLKADTAKYADIQVAMRSGYVQLTQDLPGIAAHFVNPAYLSDGRMMDPEHPEFLLYTKRLDGNWRLVGVMFYQEKSTDAAPSYFGPLDAWHRHENLCFVGPNVRVATGQADCKGGLFVKETAWQLHVWVVPSANGVFAHDLESINPGAFPGATRPAAQDLVKVP